MSTYRILIKLILPGLVLALAGTPEILAREKVERVFVVSGTPSVTVRNISGNIEVGTWRRAEVKVVAVKSSESIEIEMEQVGDSVRISSKSPTRAFGIFGSRGSVDYTITMPAEGNLEANSISGDISVEDLRGDLTVESVSGDLRLRRLGKRLWASSVSGDIQLSDGQLDLDISTVSGDVEVVGVQGRLNAKSVSGSVRIQRSRLPRATLSTTSGDVVMDAALEKGGSYSISSHSGYIGLYLGRDSSFELTASTFSGEVESDLPLSAARPDSRRSRGRSIRGTYGSGEATIEVKTFSGDIRIIAR